MKAHMFQKAFLPTKNYSRQNCSSSFKLDRFRWCTAICKSYNRFSIGLRSGHWLGHSKTLKKVPLKPLECCFSSSMLRVIVLLEGEPLSQSQISGRLKQVSPKNFPVFSAIHPSILQFWPVSQSLPIKNIATAWCCHHHASLWGCFSIGRDWETGQNWRNDGLH